jgi:hypothetical protein
MLIKLELTDDHAEALAQMCKRSIIERVRPFAGDETEAETMLEALAVLEKTLADVGFAPR